MSQQEILDVLKTRPDDWFTANDLQSLLGISITACTRGLSNLIEQDFVEYDVKLKNGKPFRIIKNKVN